MTNETNPPTTRRESSRRAVLKGLGAAGVAAAFGGVASGQETTQETPQEEDRQPIVLGGEVQFWLGFYPESIQGTENPVLQLEAGTAYRVVWVNLDGLPHSFVIRDADDNDLIGTEIFSEQHSIHTLDFEATEEMAEYYCEVHPTSMLGTIEFGAGMTTEE